jgi:hypothetical protein
MRLPNFLFWRQNAEYTSKYSVPESIARLKNVVHSGFVPRAGVYGRVSENKVRLYRVIPFWANSFCPFFTGRFECTDGKVVLSGSYSMNPAVKVFMTIWFIAVLLAIFIEIATYLPAIVTGKIAVQDLDPLLLVPLGLFMFGVVLVKSGQSFSRNDINYISNVVKDAIQ